MFPASFTVTSGGSEHEWHDTSVLRLRAGLAWQASTIAHYIAEGRQDSPVHSLADAIAVMRTIDALRTQLSAGATG